jgi:steroid delta-isomerase-like uncharacterized protein
MAAVAASLLVLLLPIAWAAHAIGSSLQARSNEDASVHNKIVARRVFEAGLSEGRFDVPYTDDFVGHGGGTTTFTHEAGMAEAKGWRLAFPDLKVSVDLVFAEDDLVAVRWTARGTNSGVGNGIPATGKQVQTSGTAIFRFVDGAIAEEWTAGDSLGLLKQLGLMPPPSGAVQSQ